MSAAVEPGRVMVEIAEGIGTIRFHHPKSNSLPGALLQRLAAEVTALGADGEVRVIVLRSDGTGPFCAGASFQELQAIQSAEQGTNFFMGFARLILAMVRCPKFVIARVHGKAVGGGVGVVAASDYAIAASEASIKLSELAIGIGPFVVGPVIERKIGPAALSTLGVNATEWRDAEWAREKGLYSEVRETVEEVDSAVQALAARLAASNPEAMAQMKQTFWQGTDHWEVLLPERAAMSGRLVLSDFAWQAISGR